MMPAELSDAIRWFDALGSLALVVASCYAIRLADNRALAVLFAVYGIVFPVLLTAGHLRGAGEPADWRLVLLAAAVAVVDVATIIHVRRELADRRHE